VIVIVGFMGAGKTTVGRMLADRLGLPFVDSDLVIEQRARRSVRQIFAEDGEPAFRDLEHEVVAGLLAGPDAVLALGGGAANRQDTRELLKAAHVVYLSVGFAESMLRVAGDTYRPLLTQPGVEDLYARRLATYDQVATLTVATDGRRPEAICQEVISRLVAVPAVPAGTSTVLVSCTGGTYNVQVGTGLLAEAARLMPTLPYARTAVVLAGAADTGAAATLAAALGGSGLEPRVLEVPDTQRAKNLTTVAQVSSDLAELAVHRDDLVVGIGGEVVCDIAGFVASTYNRGMRLALVPTTLAAQADAAVGGKASLNLPQGRNLLGTVHQPVAVICDVGLSAGQRREYSAGLAEAAKHALISGGDLVGLLRDRATELRAGDVGVLAEVVAKSVQVKADIVSGDEREQGDRLHLNYGHTFGHAIEQVRGPDVADDGEAVAVGMMAAAHLARRQGRITGDLVGLHRELLAALGLPVSGKFGLDELRAAWLRDKKYRGSTRFVVLNGLGRPEAGVPADERTLAGVLADLAA
jgi:3-dehydroquinate synthase/shikimate kinase/3-dehydroquinate synthase